MAETYLGFGRRRGGRPPDETVTIGAQPATDDAALPD
jgi:hypothetical protein